MGTLYDSFEKELAACEIRYNESAEDELVALCLLALEREELVAVGYREDIISPRLAALRIPDEAREIIQHALVWAWKDEEMHTIYIRGALLKLGKWPLRLSAFTRQLAGAVGGWSASVRQHVKWSAAPLTRTAATAVSCIGSLAGKVPRPVRRHLKYGPFRNFCMFNVEAEQTAWLCWKRMVEVAQNIPALPATTARDFQRVQDDEERHARIFKIIADALNDRDELVEGETAATLGEKIEAVGEFFLPRRLRTQFSTRNPLGSGEPVWVLKGKAPEDKLSTFLRLLDQSQLSDRLQQRADIDSKSVEQLKVAIKPTFMLGYDRRDMSMVTDPELLEALAQYLKTLGCRDVAVIEARNIYDQFFQHRSVDELADYFGYRSSHYRVVDGTEEQVRYSYSRGLGQYSVSSTWKDADYRISFGKMRSHPIELAYLTVGNVEWMGGRCDEFIFLERQAQRETAIMMLLDAFPPHFAILDAYDSAADGLVGVMACPRPKRPLRLYAGSDALAVDIVAARHMGLLDPRQSSILRAACHWFGKPAQHIPVIGTDELLPDWRDPYHNEISTFLSLMAAPVYVMGSGRGSMFLPEMDSGAFPFIQPEKLPQRVARQCVRRLLGIHHSR